MRNRQAYLDEGRNDPGSDPQRREHPYDFVYLPDRPNQGHAAGHDRYRADRWSGVLQLTYRTLSPLHIGSGIFETAEQCGLRGGSKSVRGIMRKNCRPVLPGSGWKGAIRARFEAITASRIALADTGFKEKLIKLPEVLRSGTRDRDVEISDSRVRALQPLVIKPPQHRERSEARIRWLSPAEALFGCMGYRGRLHPWDGVIKGPSAEAHLSVTPLEGPAPHRLAQPGKIQNTARGKLEISRVEGRKFYYDGGIVERRLTQQGGLQPSEWIDYVPVGCTIRIDVQLDSVTLAELGALLIAAGYGKEGGVVRLGGYKPAGLGAVELTEAAAHLAAGAPTRRWRRGIPDPIDLQPALDAAREQLVDPRGLAELGAVTCTMRPEDKKS